MFRARATPEQLAAKNRELYDDTFDPLWQRTVYDALHDGQEFINLGGRALLEELAQRARLGPGSTALELCSGPGAASVWLAEHCGCQVTGVELNPNQVARARARLLRARPELGARVTCEQGDVCAYRAARRHDAVFSLDSFMLVPDLTAALRCARAALVPGAPLTVVAIVAGPRIDDELRRYLWDSEGMISLPTPEEYAQLAHTAGFDALDVSDLTPRATDASLTMLNAIADHRDVIVSIRGQESFDNWHTGAGIYLDAFRTGRLGYLRVEAR